MEISPKFVEIAEKVNGILSFFTLSLLLILIIFKSPHRLGTYKYLMIYLSIFELFYAILMVLSPSQVYTMDSAFLVAMDGNVTFGNYYEVANVLYFTMFGTSLANFGVHFIYRYFAITGNKSWTQTTPSKVIIWIASPLALGFLYTLTIIKFWAKTKTTEEFLRTRILNNTSTENLSFIGFCIFGIGQNGESYVNWHSIIGVVAVSTIITISIAIMLYFGIRCYTEIRNLTNISTVSENYRSIQNQLFMALVIQTAIPLVLMHLPSTVIAITCFLDCAPRALGQVTALFVSLYPVLDPLPNIFIIKSYRRAFLGWILRWKKETPQSNYSVSNSFSPVAKNAVSALNVNQ